MRAGPSVEAVLFDFGSVLTQPGPVREELARYERQLGLPAGALEETLGSGPHWEAASTGAISEEEYWRRAAAGLEERLPPAFGRFRQGLLLYEPLNPAVVELAWRIRGQARLGLLSNATASLGPYLAGLPRLCGLFDDVVISAEVGLRKPDPAIYELAARRLGVPLGRAVLVDDKPRNTLAARRIGMPAITYTGIENLCSELRRHGFVL